MKFFATLVAASLAIPQVSLAQTPTPSPTPAATASPTPAPKASATPAATPAVKATPAAKAGTAQTTPEGDFGSQIRFNVEKWQLPNGLTVLFQEDHTVPIISYQTWFRVGSKNEEPGLTGIAHLFEHMMFKGAKRFGPGQFETVLQANGGTFNAFTSKDYTAYHENFPSTKLELVIDIESDRMENLRITAENLKSEREVVKEERRYRVDNNPTGILSETIFGTAFRVHPYRWPIIGSMADLDNVTPENAMAFYRTFYAPNNAVLVLAGDFNPAEAKKLITKYYGGIKSQPLPDKARPAEPVQQGTRSAHVARDVQSTYISLAYHAPKAGSDESYALDLLANILGYGTSSRLYQRLVYKEQVATSASVYNMTLQDSSLFQVYVALKPGANEGRVQKAIYGEMWRPRNLVVTEAELTKAKNQVMKSYVDNLKSVHGKAEALAMNEIVFGDYERLFTDLAQYNKVTVQQIRDVAKKYLAAEKSTFVVLRPNKKAPAKKEGSR